MDVQSGYGSNDLNLISIPQIIYSVECQKQSSNMAPCMYSARMYCACSAVFRLLQQFISKNQQRASLDEMIDFPGSSCSLMPHVGWSEVGSPKQEYPPCVPHYLHLHDSGPRLPQEEEAWKTNDVGECMKTNLRGLCDLSASSASWGITHENAAVK